MVDFIQCNVPDQNAEWDVKGSSLSVWKESFPALEIQLLRPRADWGMGRSFDFYRRKFSEQLRNMD